MDYRNNADKYCGLATDGGLYNCVLSTELGDGTEPVTLQEAKDWAKIEQDADDDLIEELIVAAREICEGFTSIGFLNRTVTAVIDNANGSFRLPYGPVTDDPVGADIDGNDLELNYKLGYVETLGRMTVTYTAGYIALPKRMKTAIKQQFLFMYENRGESATGLSPMAEMLLAPVRMVL